MNILYNPIFHEHDTGNHPENALRLSQFKNLKNTDIESGDKYLPLVHSPEYIETVKKLSLRGGGKLDQETIVSPKTYEAACVAAGAAIKASETGDFALVRPPGHHAYSDHGGGFCIFNSVAVAAQNLVKAGKTVAIVDIDGHVGDGTEHFFYGTNRVLYMSLHEFPAYPGSGTVDETGESEGMGYTVNVPLAPGTSDDIYMRGFGLLLKILEQFRPDVVAVSAGFDGHQSDSLLHLKLSANLFYSVGKLLRAQSPQIFAVLEGGYNPFMLEKCVMNFTAGINGKDIYFNDQIRESTILAMEQYAVVEEQLKTNLSPYWKF